MIGISLSTRSVSTNLARPFKAGKSQESVCVAERRLKPEDTQSSLRDESKEEPDPGVETPG
jgi:hypothetical protein